VPFLFFWPISIYPSCFVPCLGQKKRGLPWGQAAFFLLINLLMIDDQGEKSFDQAIIESFWDYSLPLNTDK
jgi:hypothetical protein